MDVSVKEQNYIEQIKASYAEAQQLLKKRPPGKPEANTKGRLIDPMLQALGYEPKHRTWEGEIRSLVGAKEWVDYFLLPERDARPQLMVEAKPVWEDDLWETHKDQVLSYIRDYLLEVEGAEEAVRWIVITNFKEWHFVRLGDREPFWSFKMDDLLDASFAQTVYQRLAREEFGRQRLLALYKEHQRSELGPRFLADLKTWRLIVANGLNEANEELSTEQLKVASQKLLNRLLFIRILEAYGREEFYSLGRFHHFWKTTFRNKPFIELLRQKFEDTWESYNTELFDYSWVDNLKIPNKYLAPLILPDALPDPEVARQIGGGFIGDYRSIYNYDFTTLTHDVLGVAYEQFLAHKIKKTPEGVQIDENQETRKREGIYYTPKYIVHHIIELALAPRITTLVEEAIELLEDEEYDEAYRVAKSIFDIRVLDPACGSGSFLLQAFDFILQEVKRYNDVAADLYQKQWENEQADKGSFVGLMERDVPQKIDRPEERIAVEMLHGVDLDEQAVSLAKLSIWTRLLRARPGEYGREDKAHSRLPALTLNIRHGNSLIEVSPRRTNLTDARKEVGEYARSAKNIDLEEGERIGAADEFERRANDLSEQLNPELAPILANNDQIQETTGQVINGYDPEELPPSDVRDILVSGKAPEGWPDGALGEITENLRTSSDVLKEVEGFHPFHWPVEFPDVFLNNDEDDGPGFDVILGNPPYYNVDATFGSGARETLWLKQAFPDIYTDKTDILFYFLRQGVALLDEGGDLSYIVSRAFLQADKAQKLRKFLAGETTVQWLLDFLGNKVFEAGIATAIIHTQEGAPPEDHQLQVLNVLDFEPVKGRLEHGRPLSDLPADELNQESVPQSKLGQDAWSFGPYTALFNTIDSSGPVLEDWSGVVIGQGMQTGANSVFVLDPQTAESKDIPPSYLKTRASDIHPFGFGSTERRVLYVEDEDFDDLPQEVCDWLTAHKDTLTSRAAFDRDDCRWYQFSWPLNSEHHFGPKVVSPYRAASNRFAVDTDGTYIGLTDTTVICLEDADLDPYALSALLNSRVLNFRYRALGGIGKLTGKGMFEYFDNQIGQLPIPPIEGHRKEYDRLSSLGEEAHQLFEDVGKIVETFSEATQSMLGAMGTMVDFWEYCDPTGPYADIVHWTKSAQGPKEGHLLELDVRVNNDGFELWGNITEENDWREGNREWVLLLNIEVENNNLQELLLAHALKQIAFDNALSRKRKLTKEPAKLVRSALEVLKAPRFATGLTRNLVAVERIADKVEKSKARAELHGVLVRDKEVQEEINSIADELYGVSEYSNLMREALRIVL